MVKAVGKEYAISGVTINATTCLSFFERMDGRGASATLSA